MYVLHVKFTFIYFKYGELTYLQKKKDIKHTNTLVELID